MKEKLREYIDGLFDGTKATRQTMELRDEILQNSFDRYDDAIEQGRTAEEAYRVAVDGIGDFEPILHGGQKRGERRAARVAAAVALFTLSVIPPVAGGMTNGFGPLLGTSLMFVIVALGVGILLGGAGGGKKRRLRTLATMMYIICVTPTILTSGLGAGMQTVGLCAMFLIAAAATVCIILSAGMKDGKSQTERPADESDHAASAPQEPRSPLRAMLTPIYWLAAVALFIVGNSSGLWRYAWLVFPLFGALGDIIRGCVDIARGKSGGRRIFTGFLWLLVMIAFVCLIEQTGAWYAAWLVFPIGGALSGVISGIFELIGG